MKNLNMTILKRFLLSALLFIWSLSANAYLTYQGRIIKSGTTPLSSTSVTFSIAVQDPTGACTLYSETQSIPMTSGDGVFSLAVGKGTRSDGGIVPFDLIFSNGQSITPSAACPAGYTKVASDVLNLKIAFNDGSGTGAQYLPLSPINSVPLSMDVSKVAGVDSANVLRVNGAVATPLSSTNLTDLLAIIGGTSTKYMQSSPNGSIVPSVAAAPASPVAGQTWYNSTSNVLQYFNGTSTQTIGVSSSGISSLNGLTGGAQTFAVGTAGAAPSFSSATTTHTLNIPMASTGAVTAGLLSNADWTIFNNKQSAGNYISALTGDVTATGPGSVAATIANGAISTPKLFANPGVSRLVATDATTGASLAPLSCGLGQVLTWSATGWVCTAQSALTVGNISGTLAIANGGTGSTTQNFVDLSTTQTIAGVKTFANDAAFSGQVIARGGGNQIWSSAIGQGALVANTTGTYNTANGGSTLQSNTTGYLNTANGYSALYSNTTGFANTANGMQALYTNTTGNYNTSLGYNSGMNITGSNNTTLGFNSGLGLTTGSGNVVIGSTSAASIATLSNYILLSDGSGNERLRIDSAGNVGIGTTAPLSPLQVGSAIPAAASRGLASFGPGAFDGATAGFFAGNAAGTLLAGNAATGYTGSLLDLQIAGVSKFKVDNTGAMYGGTLSPGSISTTGNIATTGTGTISSAGNMYASSGTASTTSSTGALVVTGGAGVSGQLNVGGSANLGQSSANYLSISGAATGISPVIAAAGTDTNINLTFTPKGTGNTIFSSGNVGIGTTAPVTKLDVNGASTLYASSATSSSVWGTTNWLRAPKNTVSVFVGDSDATSGYAANDFSSDIRFNGFGPAWGDLSYYPTGGGNGNFGHFRLSLGGTTVVTTPNAKLGVGDLYASGNVGIGTTTPGGLLHLHGNTNSNLVFTGLSGIHYINALNDAGNGYIPLTINASQFSMNANSTATGLAVVQSGTGYAATFNGGNVGIGTATPGAKLSFGMPGGAPGTHDIIHLYNGGPSYTYGVGVTSGNGTEIYTATANGKISLGAYDQTTFSPYMTLASGNVGIGTTTPAATLDIKGPTLSMGDPAAYYNTFLLRSLYGPSGNGFDITMFGSPTLGSYTGGIQLSSNSGNNEVYRSAVASSKITLLGGGMQINTAPAGTASAAIPWSEKFRIDNTGNVGVGTSAPGSSLTVAGANNIGGGSASIELNNTTATTGRRYGVGSDSTGLFQVFDITGSNATRMVINSSGNVGIGTTAPAERLDLGGGNIKMGYQLIVNTCNNPAIFCTATCPAGTQATGGGCSFQGSWVVTRQSPSTTAYTCDVQAAPATSLSAYVYCANIK